MTQAKDLFEHIIVAKHMHIIWLLKKSMVSKKITKIENSCLKLFVSKLYKNGFNAELT